jgi:eukaryotic-like serine/threonine-protein kinase
VSGERDERSQEGAEPEQTIVKGSAQEAERLQRVSARPAPPGQEAGAGGVAKGRTVIAGMVVGVGLPQPGAGPSAVTLPSSPATPEPPSSELGRVLGGKYNLVRRLGAGGMGKIYRAEHVLLGVPVAVKTMHPHVAMLTENRRRFLREARAASALKHPNVVQVLDFGEDDGVPYLVMELVQGLSLAERLRGSSTLPDIAEIGRVLEGILDGVAAAHARGIVHRDLKPDNVLLAEQDGGVVVKVADFGLAYLDDPLDAGPTLTKTEAIAGTPEYMSPEQCRSLSVGPSSDLYAIGCILTVLLQGRPPFSGMAHVDVMARHMFSPPPPLARSSGAPPVPPLLERLRLDLLAKVPERRPESAAAARSRLAEAMSREAEARRLPTRKGDVPLGGREERAPAWGAAAPEPAASPPGERSVGLLRIAAAGDGLGDACEVGLDAQGIHLVEVSDLAALVQSGLGMVVIDAGPDVDAACAALAALGGAAPGVRAIVCAAGLGTDRMNALVAAGAADVARYPVTPDALARKIARVMRRGR